MTERKVNPSQKFYVVVDYSYGTKERGDLISAHSTYIAASRKASKNDNWRVTEVPPSRIRPKRYSSNPSPKLTHAVYLVKGDKSKLVCVCPKSAYANEIVGVLNQHVETGARFVMAGSTRYA